MSPEKPKRIGLVGCGTIGGHIARKAAEHGFAEIAFVCDLDEDRARETVPGAEVFSDLGRVASFDVDLVVETANADVMRGIALEVLAKRDFLPFTVTALADDDFRESVRTQCGNAGTRLFIPHGGILGLDGVYDGRAVLDEVTFKTTKNPKNLGLDDSQVGLIYDGPTRDACFKFPRNVNVHAAFAVAGVGFDKQRSIIISDPETKQMRHDITVKGQGLEWTLGLASVALGGVTGSYTPESAASTVARVLGGNYDIVLA